MIEAMAKENNTFLIKMSNKTGEGVVDVKSKSCDILLEYRLNNKTKGKERSKAMILNPQLAEQARTKL